MSVGSCTYDMEKLLKAIPPAVCQKYIPKGQECDLPLNPGHYGTPDGKVTINLSDLGSMVNSLLDNAVIKDAFEGKFHTKIEFVGKNGEIFLCVEGGTTIVFNK